MLLSEKLKNVCFEDIKEPIEYFDKLAIEAKQLEMVASIHNILIKELGQNVIENAIKKSLER